MAQPLLATVRPEAIQLVQQVKRVFNAHLAQAFALIAELDPCDGCFSIPAMLLPDVMEPFLVMHLHLTGLVVDQAGVRSRLAEIKALHPPSTLVNFRVDADGFLWQLMQRPP